jgi:hypothetical protein
MAFGNSCRPAVEIPRAVAAAPPVAAGAHDLAGAGERGRERQMRAQQSERMLLQGEIQAGTIRAR